MHTRSLQPWQHDHAFGQGVRRAGERRTLLVAMLTAVMMVVEIAAGIAFGSMALLADGLHMASHAAALALAVAAYVYARRHAHDRRFTFGTGKVNALAGYSSAVVLAMFALLMAWESGNRLLLPQPIDFDQAILVACLGLAVNLGSMLLLRERTPSRMLAADDGSSDTTTRPSPPINHAHGPQPARRLPACAGRCADIGARHLGAGRSAACWAGRGRTPSSV